MRRMTPRMHQVVLVLALAIGAAACSTKGGAEKFVGSWVYAGAIDPNCNNIAAVDLTGDAVTITATDSSHIRVDLAGYCMINFDVDGFTANAQGGQSCTFDIPSLGPQAINITRWTLTMTGDDVVTSDFNGSILICFPSGTGTLTRQSDAGA
jgi:hypothetical protein